MLDEGGGDRQLRLDVLLVEVVGDPAAGVAAGADVAVQAGDGLVYGLAGDGLLAGRVADDDAAGLAVSGIAQRLTAPVMLSLPPACNGP